MTVTVPHYCNTLFCTESCSICSMKVYDEKLDNLTKKINNNFKNSVAFIVSIRWIQQFKTSTSSIVSSTFFLNNLKIDFRSFQRERERVKSIVCVCVCVCKKIALKAVKRKFNDLI